MSNGPISHRLAHLYELNKEHRQACSSYYLLPPSDDCARYMIQELGEQDDVVMRMTRDHKRNNVKPSDTFAHRKELGQTLCMSLDVLLGLENCLADSMLEDVRKNPNILDPLLDNTYGEIYARILTNTGFFLMYGTGSEFDALRAAALVMQLCDFFGYNPIEMIHERYAQVEEKWSHAVGKGGQESVESGEGAA